MSRKFELHHFEEVRNLAGGVYDGEEAISLPPKSCNLVSSKWLRESPGKRRAFGLCYEGILEHGFRKVVTDVGGGLSHITETLFERRNYVLVDPLHHVSTAESEGIKGYEGLSLHKIDWLDFNFEGSELIIANDIFPNVDYRLATFLEILLASSVKELRLILTVFYGQKFMEVKKIDSGEVLTVIPLPVESICEALEQFCPLGGFRDILRQPRRYSDWNNGRFMYFLRFGRE